MDVIILAGGKGSRLEDYLPKPLVALKNKPLIDYQINYLAKKSEKIILALGHSAELVVNHIKANHPEKNIHFSIETEPLGTAGAIKKAIEKADSEEVLVLNCDDIADIDIEKLKSFGENTICVANPILPFGRVVEKEGYASFEEKPVLNEWASCGWYIFKRKDLLAVLPEKGSLEYDVFPKLKLRVYKHSGFWKPINTKKDVDSFETLELPSSLRLK